MKMKCPHCGVRGSVSDSLIGKRVKCPKCSEIFTAAAEETPFSPDDEPKWESTVTTSDQKTDTGDSSGMTAQDEASLEEELAKIFDEMKQSPQDQNEEAAAEGSGTAAMGEDTDPLSEEELQSQLEDMMDEKCSACGTILGKGAKFELNGLVYCANCLPDIVDDEELERQLAVAGGPAPQNESGGILQKLGAVVAGLVVVAVLVAAGYYLIYM